jgi:hypothetical protein
MEFTSQTHVLDIVKGGMGIPPEGQKQRMDTIVEGLQMVHRWLREGASGRALQEVDSLLERIEEGRFAEVAFDEDVALVEAGRFIRTLSPEEQYRAAHMY